MFDETASDASSEVEFRDFLRLLRRRKLLVMLTVLVLLCASVAYSHFQTPVYAAGASVVLQASSTESLFDPSTGFRNDPGRSLQTQIEVVKSEPVRAAVRQKLGAAPPVSVSPVGQTDIMRIVAESTSRTRAADIANAYANAYIDIRLKRAVDDQLAAAQQLQTKVDELQRQIDARSGAQKDQLIQAQGVIQQKLDQLQVGANLITGGAQVVSAASPPTAPTKPKPARNAVMAVLVGLVLGIALAFLVEYLDDSIKTQEDVHRLGRGMVVVGMIPTDPTWRAKSGARLVLVADPQSHVAEAYRSLRTSIQFRSLAHPVNVLQVTSANAQEGKTTTIANLAVSLARAGQRVVVMCCDLRRPRVHEFFGLPNDVGFTSVMLGEVPLSAALQPVPGIRGIMLLASGRLPPNPSELLASPRTAEVLDALRKVADIVLIDSPPLLPVTDALVLTGAVDATLLVLKSRQTTRKEAGRAVQLLRQVDAPVMGAVLNGVKAENGYGSAQRYYKPNEEVAGEPAAEVRPA